MRYYHFDQLGSTRLITDSVGAVTDTYSYDAYGALLWHEQLGTWLDSSGHSIAQPYQYVGQLGYYTHWQEPYFGLLQLGVRFYDSQVGRFTQVDPQPQPATSQYCYSDGRPVAAADPTGETVTIRLCWDVGVPHGTLCINNQCRGFYPRSKLLALWDCCNIHIYGACCDTGVVPVDHPSKDCRVVVRKNTSREQERRLEKWIQNWEQGYHIWCLSPNFPLSDNCWTWAFRGLGQL